MTRSTRLPGRHLLATVAPALVALVALYGARDPYEATKLVVVIVLAAVVVGGAVVRAAQRGTVRLVTSPWAAAVGVFLGVALVAVLTADNPWAALYGVPLRQIGWALYAGAGVLGVTAAAATSAAGTRPVSITRRSLLVALVLLGAYGALQASGVEPSGVTSTVSGVFVTLANPNFAGAWGGALLGMAGLAVLDATVPTWERATAGAGLVASTVLVVGAGSVVGVVAAGVSTAVALAAWLDGRAGRLRRYGLPLVGLSTITAGVLGALGAFEVGPLARLGAATGVVLRRFYWDAALSMAAEAPITGLGFDRFVRHYRTHRSAAAADFVDLTVETDAAHSVPLQLLAGGGVPLLLAWLALIGMGVWAAVRAYRGADRAHRLLVAGVASVWLATTAQSLASFDVAALLVLSMVSAGLLAGLAWPHASRTWVLPGSTVTEVRRKRRTTTTIAPPAWAVPVAGTLAVFLAGGALVLGSRPLRAELAAREGAEAVQRQQPELVAQAWQRAAEAAPWEVDYPYREGLGLLQLGALEDGVAAFRRALDVQPGHVASLVSRARAHVALQQPDEATSDYLAALEGEPMHLDLKAEVAQFLVDRDPSMADALLVEVEARDPDHEDVEFLRDRLESTAGG